MSVEIYFSHWHVRVAAIIPVLCKYVFIRCVAFRYDASEHDCYIFGTFYFHVEKSYCLQPDIALQTTMAETKKIRHTMLYYQNYIVKHRDRTQLDTWKTRSYGQASGNEHPTCTCFTLPIPTHKQICVTDDNHFESVLLFYFAYVGLMIFRYALTTALLCNVRKVSDSGPGRNERCPGDSPLL